MVLLFSELRLPRSASNCFVKSHDEDVELHVVVSMVVWGVVEYGDDDTVFVNVVGSGFMVDNK